MDDPDGLVVVGVAPGAEHHRAEAELADRYTGASEWSKFHKSSSGWSVAGAALSLDEASTFRERRKAVVQLRRIPLPRNRVNMSRGPGEVRQRGPEGPPVPLSGTAGGLRSKVPGRGAASFGPVSPTPGTQAFLRSPCRPEPGRGEPRPDQGNGRPPRSPVRCSRGSRVSRLRARREPRGFGTPPLPADPVRAAARSRRTLQRRGAPTPPAGRRRPSAAGGRR